ncbi:hypothetical protein [Demequina aurantiaca]|uniref:hypothetical protein n=1 Tax=Demequina aurantiaca TaxID=676200 RepID=UPI003D32DE49
MELRTPRVFAGVFAVALAATGILVEAQPAHAVTYCEPDTGTSYVNDYAWISDTNNRCSRIAVRHSFSPNGTSYQFYTNWRSGSGNYYTSGTYRELIRGDWVWPV